MIAGLRRQFVKKRASHIRRSPVGRPALVWKPPTERRSAAVRHAGRPRGKARRLVKAVASKRGLTLAIAVLLLVAFFVPALAMRGASLPRAVLPSSPDGEQEMYRILVPEEDQSKGDAPSGQSLLKSLKVGSYTIRQGETISQISQRLKLNIDTLISFNGIRDARVLGPGTVLRYPNAEGLKYRVRRGDTLEKISQSLSVPLESILDWNGIASSIITPGQEIFIPGAHLSPSEVNRVLGNLFIFPVSGRVSSRFGIRADPFTGVPHFHNGVDIYNALDTPVAAAMAGRVAAAGYNYSYGRFVILKHPGTGFQTMYAHLDKVLVSQGENVEQGHKVGLLGNTGHVTGPHLHFSLFKNNEPVDPLQYLK